jgi:O-succinylhomoserine sulfhydrylase
VLLKSLETLPLRVERQTRTAGELADALAGQPKIARLIYPGRPDHPQADIIRKQMPGGSNLIAMEIAGGKAGAFRLQNALTLVKISNNLGDAKSLITHPATTTHQRFTPEERAEMGVSDGLVRLSVGLEHRDDILADLLQALEGA